MMLRLSDMCRRIIESLSELIEYSALLVLAFLFGMWYATTDSILELGRSPLFLIVAWTISGETRKFLLPPWTEDSR